MEVLPILAHENAREYVDIPNCLTIASTSNKNCFQYVGVPLNGLINENTLSLARNLSTVPFKLYLTILVVSVPGLTLCIAKFIDKSKWCCSYTGLIKNI